LSRPKIKLIGGLRLGKSEPGDYSFYGNMFSRLPREVKNTGELTRELAFDYFTDSDDPITFLGIEVDRIEDIPEGMIAWDIDGRQTDCSRTERGRKSISGRKSLTWQWWIYHTLKGNPD
jgi:hypothetical protein